MFMIKPKIASKLVFLGSKLAEMLGYETIETKTTYNNLFETILLNSYTDNKGNYNIIQLGANDGITNDPIHNFVVNNDISGLLVEPLPDIYETLLKNYENSTNLKFANAAISPSEGEIAIYRIAPWFTEEYQRIYKKNANPSGASSLYYENVASFLKKAAPEFFSDKNIEDYIETVYVNSMPLRSLFDQYGIDKVHFLQMDLEGYDFEAVKMLLETTDVRPLVTGVRHLVTFRSCIR